MSPAIDSATICRKIADMRAIAEELRKHEARLPALGKNIKRILASIRMLEINFSDIDRDYTEKPS